MKMNRSLRTAFALASAASRLLLTAGATGLGASAHAVTFPVFADTAGAPGKQILKTAGAATTLPVSAKSNAYIYFGVAQSGVIPDASAVTHARLWIYFPKVTRAGNLTVSLATTNGDADGTQLETFAGTSHPAPGLGAAISNSGFGGTFGVAPTLSKDNFFFDVTPEVKSWLSGGSAEFGFVISGDAAVLASIGAKEGSGSGYPAYLEVDVSGSSNQVGAFTAGVDNLFTIASGGVNQTTPPAARSAGIELANFSPSYGFSITSLDALSASGLDFRSHYNSETGTSVMFMSRSTGNVGIGTTSPATTLDVAGEITCVAVNITSDRKAKEQFKPINTREVLDKVTRLPITEWQYKAGDDQPGAVPRHIGPMAQDFHAAFGVGHDDRHITSVDEDGVALAAIQGLNEKLDARVQEQNAEICAMRETVSELRKVVQELNRKVTGRKTNSVAAGK